MYIRCLALLPVPLCWAQFENLPIYFEANRAQFRKPAQFVSAGLLLAPAEAQFLVANGRVVRMFVEGGNTAAPMEGLDKLPGEGNYFMSGDPRRWRIHVPHFTRVRGGLMYYRKGRQLEVDFVVAPGSNPHAIRLRFDGANPRLDADGDLLLGTIRLQKPAMAQCGGPLPN